MKRQTSKVLAYCFDMLCFVFQEKEARSKINAIYLFGSATRGELHAQSDVDLFVESFKKNEETAKRLMNAGISKFTASTDYQKWKLFHFQHPFSVQIGQVQEWDLKLSIASEGVLLYSKNVMFSKQSRMVLFVITFPKIKSKYAKIRRLLFGRDEEIYKKERGKVAEMSGRKLSSNVFMIPKEEQTSMIYLLAKEKILFSMTEVALLEES